MINPKTGHVARERLDRLHIVQRSLGPAPIAPASVEAMGTKALLNRRDRDLSRSEVIRMGLDCDGPLPRPAHERHCDTGMGLPGR